jgi:hypothetical protein
MSTNHTPTLKLHPEKSYVEGLLDMTCNFRFLDFNKKVAPGFEQSKIYLGYSHNNRDPTKYFNRRYA